MPIANPQAKHWVFTINNFTEENVETLKVIANDPNTGYIVFGREAGENGTPHLQGYIAFKRKLRRNQVRSKLPSNTWLEQSKGNPKQASEYCKKDGDYEEFGQCPGGSGTRNNLKQLQSDIKDGKTIEEIRTEHFGLYLRYSRVIHGLVLINAKRRDWVTEVLVYWGPTGTGKTRRVYQEAGDEPIYVHPGGMWFDGYEGQEIVLFDDFGGSEFKLTYLLKLLDRYPMSVPVKGGFVNFAPKKVYITSNHASEWWYPNAFTRHQEALQRRITSETEIKQDE